MSIKHKLLTLHGLMSNWALIPGFIIKKLSCTSIFHVLSDETFEKLQYRWIFGNKLDLSNPVTFNAKMQWLKLYNRRPEYTLMADKLKARDYVANRAGKEYLVPLITSYSSVHDIIIDDLPEQFVIKCNHDTGSVIICKDKSSFNVKKARIRLAKHMKNNMFWYAREWPYKDIKPCIIVEELLTDSTHDSLPVFKFFCFDGEPVIIQSIQNDKNADETIDYFDCKWNRYNLRQDYPNSRKPLDRPNGLDDMISLARTLATGQPFIRVDLYYVDERIYFSEFTFFSDAGNSRFEPPEWDKKLGDLLSLPEKVM